MSHVPSSSQNPSTDFAGRPPSQAWEMIRLTDSPQHFFWVWFKPVNLPCGLTLRIPDETYQGYSQRGLLSVRKFLLAAGIEPSCVAM